MKPLRRRQRLGKYRIERRIGSGGYATVYAARDTIENVLVALKVSGPGLTPEERAANLREVRVTARLDHPNILPVKNAEELDGRFVVAHPLARETLHDRLGRRLGATTALDLATQLLSALAHAHGRHVIHCDVKPENVLLMDDKRICLADFGIAKVTRRTISAAGTGTLGYMAPEQAMGKPSARSDVFSAALVIYRMLSGRLPSWPYEWPLPGAERLRSYNPAVSGFLQKALAVDARKRFRDCGQMLEAWERLLPTARERGAARRRKPVRATRSSRPARDWEALRQREFKQRFGRALGAKHSCRRCDGPVSETMTHCPWCGDRRKRHDGETSFPAACPRCRRGVKLDWTWCPWCYGAAIGPLSERTYADRRYLGRCPDGACGHRPLLPFMRYSPWCRIKLNKVWPVPGHRERCKGCGWGVLSEYWNNCPWCGRACARTARRARRARDG